MTSEKNGERVRSVKDVFGSYQEGGEGVSEKLDVPLFSFYFTC